MSQVYSEEDLLESIRECYEEHGECTTSTFNNFDGPCVATVTNHFDSWTSAKEQAGVSTNLSSYSDTELLEILEMLHSANPPVDNRILRENEELPSAVVYTNHFGSVGHAIAESSIESEIYTQCGDCGAEFIQIGKHWSGSDCSPPELSRTEKDILIGLLMGDANIVVPDANESTSHCYLEASMINEDFIKYLSDRFGQMARNVTHRPGDGENAKEQFRFHTRPHIFFDKLRQWYGEDGKRFPEDLTLNPTIAKMWYVTDGGLRWGSKTATPGINTSNETDRREYLLDLFKQHQFDPSFYFYPDAHHCASIAFTGDDRQRFLEWIGSPPPGFEYKWERSDRERYDALKAEVT